MKINTLSAAIVATFALSSCDSTNNESTPTTNQFAKVFTESCMDGAEPITSVSDFNADGVVDNMDVSIITSVIDSGIYYTIYDRNVDGAVDQLDLDKVNSELGNSSTALDQEVAALFDSVKHLQLTKTKSELNQKGYSLGTSSLRGHGEHWLNNIGNETISPLSGTNSEFSRAEGLNIPKANGEVWALFWGQAANPVFANGADDYPMENGNWMSSQVTSFAATPPAFNEIDHDKWHTHAGLCITNNGQTLNQHISFEACQALPDSSRGLGELSPWINIWMLHAWLFVPNPDGLFANTHRCLDTTEPLESSINGDRTVPEAFHHHP